MKNTLFLRFRDLVTGAGETITEHREIIDDNGYVWWGWWKRPYEQIPEELFVNILEDPSMEIYLLDTGWDKSGFRLFKANLLDIEYSHSGSELQSPEPEYTPSYYNKNWLHVWFKLGAISSEPDRDINSIKLTSLPSWPEEKLKDIEEYIGKEFSTQEDLRRIDVTLWHVEIEGDDH